MTMIARDRILTMIPHAGAMCLLDTVLQWDAETVRCASRRFRAADNPLRRADGVLGAACGIEIAAQAMAVHGRLVAGDDGPPPCGYLASLRDVQFHARALDHPDGDLIIDATRLSGDCTTASYRFTLTTAGIHLLSGRAMVLLRAGA